MINGLLRSSSSCHGETNYVKHCFSVMDDLAFCGRLPRFSTISTSRPRNKLGWCRLYLQWSPVWASMLYRLHRRFHDSSDIPGRTWETITFIHFPERGDYFPDAINWLVDWTLECGRRRETKTLYLQVSRNNIAQWFSKTNYSRSILIHLYLGE